MLEDKKEVKAETQVMDLPPLPECYKAIVNGQVIEYRNLYTAQQLQEYAREYARATIRTVLSMQQSSQQKK